MSAKRHRTPFFYRLVKVVLFTLYVILFRFRATNANNFPSDGRGVIFAPNHASFLDPPIIGISVRHHVTYLAKEYLFKPLLLGAPLRWMWVLPVKSQNSDFRSMRDLIRILKEGRQIVVFPEGTRSEMGRLKENPEPGVGFLAMKSGAHVVPVFIRGTYEAWPKGKKFFRCKPVTARFGESFIPAEDPRFKDLEDPYTAVSREIMTRIAAIQEKICGEENKTHNAATGN